MRYLIIGLVLFVIFGEVIAILAKAMDGSVKLTKHDRLIVAALSLALSSLSTGALALILNY